MTVASSVYKAGPFNGNGVTDTFPFTFKVFDSEYLVVTKADEDGLETVLVLDTDYTVSLNADQDADPGGDVVCTTAPAVGETLTLSGSVPYSQETDLLGGGNFSPSVIELALDKIVILCKQLLEMINRSLRLPVSTSADVSAELPTPEANALLAWNSTATGLVNSDASSLASVVAYATWRTDVFNGTGAQTAFTLTADPGTVHNMDVFISGVSKVNGVDFTVSGTTLQFAVAPASGTGNIVARYGSALPTGTVDVADITYTHGGTGGVQRDLQDVLEAMPSPEDFGAVHDGTTNDTAALLAFYTYCIDNQVDGHIPGGDYVVTAGVLEFICGGADAPLPYFHTSGEVRYLRADATDSYLLSFVNSVGSALWQGGGHGRVHFVQNGKATAASQHGLRLYGIEHAHFGGIIAEYMGGNALHFPEVLTGGSNPDPWHVYNCRFELVEANYCVGKAVDNRNWVGLTGCRFVMVRAIECQGGVFAGLGAGNTVDTISAGSCAGWAIDDGTHSANTGGSPSRFYLGLAELDDVENGIRLNKATQIDMRGVRFIHRWDFSALNTANLYWPRTAIQIGAGTAPSLSQIKIECVHRIENGGAQVDMGTFCNLNSNTSAGVEIDQYIQNNTSSPLHAYTDASLHTGLSQNSDTLLLSRNRVIAHTQSRMGVIVRGATSINVLNGGFGAGANKLNYATEVSDKSSLYDNATNYWYTAPWTGVYQVQGKICIALTSGTRVRLGFAVDVGGVVTVVAARTHYAPSANAESYEIADVITLNAGDRLFLMADQNSGGSVALSAPNSASADLTWSVFPV